MSEAEGIAATMRAMSASDSEPVKLPEVTEAGETVLPCWLLKVPALLYHQLAMVLPIRLVLLV